MTVRLSPARRDGLRRDGRRLRWRIQARYSDGRCLLVIAESTTEGLVLDLQAADHAGTTGDAALDDQVCEYIGNCAAYGRVSRVIRGGRS